MTDRHPPVRLLFGPGQRDPLVKDDAITGLLKPGGPVPNYAALPKNVARLDSSFRYGRRAERQPAFRTPEQVAKRGP